jgi:hypothetical protein
MKKAVPGLVPKRFLELNIRAFEKGYNYGVENLNQEKQESKASEPKEETAVQETKKTPIRKAKK